MSAAVATETQTSSASVDWNVNELIISIKHIERDFVADDGSVTQALSDVNLDIRKGELISIIGPSGCGKTTLLRLISGLDKPQRGEVTFKGHEIEGPNPERGYVFQQGSLFPWLTVEENIAFGLKAQGKYKEHKDEVGEYLNKVGLAGFEKSYPHQISGGMAQRVAIARALIDHPEVLLLDEPMGALDSFTRADLQDRLLDLWEKYHMTMILVTHDVDEAIYLGNRVVIMTPRPGRIKEIVPIDLAHRDRVSDDFTAYRKELLTKLHFNVHNHD
ncbi:ABC transporter ATP-binding protein [Bifidobacterium cebidarum]|uniref:Taurine-transporting AtPase n=1 Tax=Bifidobacterium cebidarum TaxID=2650773 RepID=A0A6I1GCV1_9BIFI|nr:ABC transporter ATP-binding protein [Bifidobacterium cebidarum]KAB7786533.1 taurine-transporting AtPase [Bifidobacterium cebidarum]